MADALDVTSIEAAFLEVHCADDVPHAEEIAD